MRRRVWASILVAGWVLAGCRQGEDSGKVVIRLANWGGAKEGTAWDKKVDDIYRQFERENPGVEIREEGVPGEYVAKMTLAFIAKAEPDVMMLDASSAAMFIDSGIVTNLTPFIEKDPSFDLNDFYPNVVNIARRDKALYAIPNDFTPMVMYYNKRLFDKAGVPYPDASWNFEQFRAIAKKLTLPADKPNDPPKQYGFVLKNWAAGWVMWLWNNGADHMSPDGTRSKGYLDSPQSAGAVRFLSELVAKDEVSPSISQVASMGVDPFSNGQAAMTVSGHWSMLDYANAPKGADGKPKITWDDIGVVALPHNVQESQTVMYESGFAIGAHCKHKEMAWKFIRYMTSRRVEEIYQSSGIAVCARKDVAEARAKASPLEAQFIPIIANARPPYGSRIEGYEFVEDQMQKAMDGVLQSGKTPEAALSQSAEKIDREFSKR